MSITIFTDGSYLRKTNKAGYGIYFPGKELPNVSEKFTNEPTNQRAELFAILEALLLVTEKLKVNDIHIYTDSEYSIKSITVWMKAWAKNNWKTSGNQPVKNLDILNPIYKIMEEFTGQIQFHHVRSHTKKTDELSINNQIADDLAVAGSNK